MLLGNVICFSFFCPSLLESSYVPLQIRKVLLQIVGLAGLQANFTSVGERFAITFVQLDDSEAGEEACPRRTYGTLQTGDLM